MLDYYLTLPHNFSRVVQEELEREMNILQNLLILTRRYKQTELTEEIDLRLQELISRLSDEMNS